MHQKSPENKTENPYRKTCQTPLKKKKKQRLQQITLEKKKKNLEKIPPFSIDRPLLCLKKRGQVTRQTLQSPHPHHFHACSKRSAALCRPFFGFLRWEKKKTGPALLVVFDTNGRVFLIIFQLKKKMGLLCSFSLLLLRSTFAVVFSQL